MDKFELAGTTIDMSRGEITFDGCTESVEPKVLAVLQLLIEAEGEVVSQEDIFATVWPTSVFSQSSVQRCIAILRKTMGDDAKTQSIIVTHPKLGYSLKPKAIKLTTAGSRYSRNYLGYVLIAALVLVGLLTFGYIKNNTAPNIQVTESQLISASEANESQPEILSERYLSFIRYEQSKGQAIWLFDLVEQREQRLTNYYKHIKDYQWLDRDTLLYALNFNEKVEIYRLVIDSINVEGKHNLINESTLIATLTDIDVFRGFHLTQQGKILYQAVIDRRSQLLEFDIGVGRTSVVLDESVSFKPYGFDVNSLNGKIALIGFNEISQTVVKQLVDKQLIDIATFDTNIYQIDWLASKDQLLLTQGKNLINLTLSGEVEEVNYNTTAFIQQPTIDSVGKRLAFAQQHIDSDLWISHSENELNVEQSYRIVNSKASDFAGRFSADGQLIAYISNKTGFPQLFVKDITSGEVVVAFNNPERKFLLSPPVWHPSRRELVSTVNEKLLMIDISTDVAKWHFVEGTAVSPFAWYQSENALLVLDLTNNRAMMSKYDLDTGIMTALSDNTNHGGLLDSQDNLYKITLNQVVSDSTTRALNSGIIIAAISTQAGIYLQVEENQVQKLMFYRFDTHDFIELYKLPNDVYFIWDVHPHDQRLLFEKSVTQQDIVLLKLN